MTGMTSGRRVVLSALFCAAWPAASMTRSAGWTAGSDRWVAAPWTEPTAFACGRGKWQRHNSRVDPRRCRNRRQVLFPPRTRMPGEPAGQLHEQAAECRPMDYEAPIAARPARSVQPLEIPSAIPGSAAPPLRLPPARPGGHAGRTTQRDRSPLCRLGRHPSRPRAGRRGRPGPVDPCAVASRWR